MPKRSGAVYCQRTGAVDSGRPGQSVLARARAISSGPFAFPVGAGALLNSVEIRRVLAIVSLALLLFLAAHFAIGAWKIYRAHRSLQFQAPKNQRRGGFLLGLFIVLMSPWSVTFWLAVIGSQPAQNARVRQSLGIAVAVVLGALTWGVVLCTAVRWGAHVFPTRAGRSVPKPSPLRLCYGSPFGSSSISNERDH